MSSQQSAPDIGSLPDNAVAGLRGVFASHPLIERVVLYGSRAKGTHRNASDIDLVANAPELTVAEFLRIDGEIDDLLLPYKVDFALRHRIHEPDLLDHIDRVGIVFFQQ